MSITSRLLFIETCSNYCHLKINEKIVKKKINWKNGLQTNKTKNWVPKRSNSDGPKPHRNRLLVLVFQKVGTAKVWFGVGI